MLGFRVWDSDKKEMINMDRDRTENKNTFCLDHRGVLSLPHIVIPSPFTGDSFLSRDSHLGIDSVNEVFIPMQSTGLKDKAGKEIFVGDFIKVERKFNDSLSKSGYFVVDEPFEIHRDWELSCVDLCIGIESMEVIGNRMENPELLERL